LPQNSILFEEVEEVQISHKYAQNTEAATPSSIHQRKSPRREKELSINYTKPFNPRYYSATHFPRYPSQNALSAQEC